MPKVIKHIRPKQSMSDHTCCDKCGLTPTFRAKDYSLFVCSECANRLELDPKSLIEIAPNHVSQLLPKRERQRPFRPRKSDAKYRDKLSKIDQSLRAKLTACVSAEQKQTDVAEKSSARLRKENERLLRRSFRADDASRPV